MSPAIQAFLILEVVRVVCICAGCLLAYLGYRLFRLGIYEKQGELKAEYKDASLAVRQVGPGVFFALFGVIMAYTGFARKFEVGPSVQTPATEIHVVASPLADQRSTSDPDATVIQRTTGRGRVGSGETHRDTPDVTITALPTSSPNTTSLTPEDFKRVQDAIKLTNSQQVVPQ